MGKPQVILQFKGTGAEFQVYLLALRQLSERIKTVSARDLAAQSSDARLHLVPDPEYPPAG